MQSSCWGDRGELCAAAPGPGLLSLVVRSPGNMQGLLLATFLLAALSQVSSLRPPSLQETPAALIFAGQTQERRRWGKRRG